jgi:hypothetical protein
MPSPGMARAVDRVGVGGLIGMSRRKEVQPARGGGVSWVGGRESAANGE